MQSPSSPPPPLVPEPARGVDVRAIWLVLGSIGSVQVGSSIAKQAFTEVGPLAMLWLRLAGATLVLLPLALATRRSTRRARRGPVSAGRHAPGPIDAPPAGPDATDPGAVDHAPIDPVPVNAEPVNPERGAARWAPLAAYAVCLVGMNATVYQAFARLPVGIAVTLEFIGPLTVGVLGTRRARDLLWPALAVVGVALLGFTPTHLDPVGVVFALAAAACWGGYILTAARVGESWRAMDALLVSCALGAAVFAGPVLADAPERLFTAPVLLTGLAVGTLSTALPYTLEIQALKKLPTRLFGILMSMEPAAAALAALVLLGERLSATDLVAMACVIAASVGATRTS